MRFSIVRRFEFAAAHHLLGLADGHKCARVHGHNYVVDVEVSGPLGPTGMVLDAEAIDAIVGPLVRGLDHRDLNETLPQPTAENIAAHLVGAVRWLIPAPAFLVAVTVGENGRLSARCAL